MKLTGTEINKAYSEQLAKLLLDGYTLVVARENGSLKSEKTIREMVVLEKEGKQYEFGFWYEGLNRNTGKYTLNLVEFDKHPLKREISESENLLETPFIYYSYTFGLEGIYHLYKYFAFSTEEEALELYEKRKQRKEYREWARQHIINTFKVAKTNYKGFKKDVTVESLRYSYKLTNKNGRECYVQKETGRVNFY
jgi:hypothetical protein